MSSDLSFETIRLWDGSKHRAFEELAFQLREPAPPCATEVKTGDPDAGVEWYVTFESSEQWGWQAKYIFNVDTLFSAMRTSVKAVAAKRPQLTRLTFCIPIDLPEDHPTGFSEVRTPAVRRCNLGLEARHSWCREHRVRRRDAGRPT
jgi:2-polyprenyl-6-methoxyphenol hydroxylase-like FAD-dependent oxidoreductase